MSPPRRWPCPFSTVFHAPRAESEDSCTYSLVEMRSRDTWLPLGASARAIVINPGTLGHLKLASLFDIIVLRDGGRNNNGQLGGTTTNSATPVGVVDPY